MRIASFTLSLLLVACSLSAKTRETCPIILPPNAIPSEVTAAKELQNYLHKIFPGKFPIVRDESISSPAIRLGQSATNSQLLGGLDFSALKPDEIILKTQDKNLILTGERPRGTLYAVYEFLERAYGVRFWNPSITDYPHKKEFTIPQIDYRYAPVFRDRKTNYELARFPEFSVRMRINHDTYMPRRYPPVSGEWGGYHSIRGWVHTFLQLIPLKKYYVSHPEFFALVNGRRDNRANAQLCMSNPELRKELVKNIRQWLKENPEQEVVSLSQSDAERFCSCGNCRNFIKRHGNLTDLLLDMVNEVASSIQQEFPKVKVETLAYRKTRKPPKTIRPADNVIIRLCAIECDASKPLDSKGNMKFADDLKKWSEIAPELYIWNYVTNFTQFYRPQPNLKHLGRDLRFFAKYGAVSVYQQGLTRFSRKPETLGFADLSDLRLYLICKLLWNPALDADQVINEFLYGVYGPAAPELRRYIDLINDAPQKHPDTVVDCYSNSTAAWLEPDTLIAAWQAMERAKQKAGNNPELLKRIKVIAISINLALLERPELWKPQCRKELQGIDWKKLLEEQLSIAGSAGVDQFAEHGGSFEDTRKRISRSLAGPVGGPREPAELKGRSWYALPVAVDGKLFEKNRYSFIESDPGASIGKAVRMTTQHSAWWAQVNQPPEGEFEVFAEVRCDGAEVSGNAMLLGFINNQTTEPDRKPHKKIKVSASGIKGKEYRLIKIGEAKFTSAFCLYAAPVVNPTVSNVWIDRFILVEKK